MRIDALRDIKVHPGRLAELLAATRSAPPPLPPPCTAPTESLVWGLLAWECPQSRAAAAYERLRARVVDLNELRVCLTDEIHVMIGDRYPRARKRASRIRRALRDIHQREFNVALDRLREVPASDAAAYLLRLDGMLPYVAAFACLHGLHHPVIPVDSRLHDALTEEGIADPSASPAEISQAITDQIEPEACSPTHLRLWAWIDSRQGPAGSEGETGAC